jgi:hypothetical protein
MPTRTRQQAWTTQEDSFVRLQAKSARAKGRPIPWTAIAKALGRSMASVRGRHEPLHGRIAKATRKVRAKGLKKLCQACGGRAYVGGHLSTTTGEWIPCEPVCIVILARAESALCVVGNVPSLECIPCGEYTPSVARPAPEDSVTCIQSTIAEVQTALDDCVAQNQMLTLHPDDVLNGPAPDNFHEHAIAQTSVFQAGAALEEVADEAAALHGVNDALEHELEVAEAAEALRIPANLFDDLVSEQEFVNGLFK